MRTKNEKLPENPLTIHDLVLPDEYRNINGNNFLIYDNKLENRVLMFSTNENLNTLHTFKNWMADGTFQAVPKLFYQLYTIHGYKNKTTFPLIYILMANRTKSYYEILQLLKNKNPNFNPHSIIIDFEKAFVTAFIDEFPQTKVKGCFFHFQQCIWRKIQENGLQTLYSQNIEFSLQVRHLTALAFVPTKKVISYFEKLIDSIYFVENENNLSTLVDYFKDT